MYQFFVVSSEQLMPIYSFVFMFLLLRHFDHGKMVQRIMISLFFSLIMWTLTGAILLAGGLL